MRLPECVERRVEDRQVLVPVHQQRAASEIHVVARRKVDILQRNRNVEQPADIHLEAKAAQQAPEDHQVIDEAGHVVLRRYACWTARALALSISRLIPCARSVSMSSLALRTTPSV